MCQATPVEANWVQTAPPGGCMTIQNPVPNHDDCRFDFGTRCVALTGGRTPAFWAGQDGQAAFESDDGGAAALQMLVALELREALGAAFDPGTYADSRAWLLAGDASDNMAYVLSVQLSAAELSVWAGLLPTNVLVHAPGTASADADGVAMLQDVLDEANAELGAHGYVPEGDPARAYQQDLKNAIQAVNDNTGSVVGPDCRYTFPQ